MPPLPAYPDNVFFEIYVHNNPKGGSVVFWGLRRQFIDPLPYHFTVQWAEAASSDNWQDVASVTNTYFATDPVPRQFAVEIESFYRIKLTTPSGSYTSFPQQATGIWNKRDWLIARDICRKEQLVAHKFAGREGWLLKRIVWGERCPQCSDYDTEEVSNSKCPVCYGTGKVGGYWPAFPVWPYELEGGPQQRHKKQDDQVGMRDDQIWQARMLAYPHISTYDIFVEKGSGNRYVIRNIGVAAEMRSIPLVNNVEMRLAAYTDAVYNVPLEPQPYSNIEIPVITEVTDDNFTPLPDTPIIEVLPAETPQEDPAPEPETEPVTFDSTPKNTLWWGDNQWHVGLIIGSSSVDLYRTINGTSNPYYLPNYTWNPADLTVSRIDTQRFELAGSAAGVTGTYVQAGTYNNMFVYRQQ